MNQIDLLNLFICKAQGYKPRFFPNCLCFLQCDNIFLWHSLDYLLNSLCRFANPLQDIWRLFVFAQSVRPLSPLCPIQNWTYEWARSYMPAACMNLCQGSFKVPKAFESGPSPLSFPWSVSRSCRRLTKLTCHRYYRGLYWSSSPISRTLSPENPNSKNYIWDSFLSSH